MNNTNTFTINTLDDLVQATLQNKCVDLSYVDGIDTDALSFVQSTQPDGFQKDDGLEQYELLEGLGVIEKPKTFNKGSLTIKSVEHGDLHHEIKIDKNNEAYEVVEDLGSAMIDDNLTNFFTKREVTIQIKILLKERRAEKREYQEELYKARNDKNYKRIRFYTRAVNDCAMNIKRLSNYLDKLTKKVESSTTLKEKLFDIRAKIQDAFVVESNEKRSAWMEQTLISIDECKGEAYRKIVGYVLENKLNYMYKKMGI